MVGMDSSGRIDRSGHVVGFYPSIRGRTPVTSNASVARNVPSNTSVRENPQSKAYPH